MDCTLISFVIFLILQMTRGFPLENSKLKNNGEMHFKTLFYNYQDEISLLKKEIASLEKRVVQLETKNSNHVKESNLAENKDGGLTENHFISKRSIFRRRRRMRRPEVAFQATLMKPSATVKMLDTITFNNVITNIGHAYNKHTGVFIAPLAGTYTFNTNIVSERGHYVEASIVRNGKVVVSAISDHRIPEDGNYFTTWDQGNAVAILRLQKGDKVSVTLQWPEGSHVIHGIGKSSFSGYLLR